MAISVETYALCKKYAKNYCDTHASTLTEEQAVQAVANYFNENPNAIVTNEELESILAGYLTEHQDISGKLNKLPNVEDENDPGYGYPYWIPYNFEFTPEADKIKLTLHTLTLDNNFLKMDFNKDIPVATTNAAGFMSSADKTKLDSALTEHQDLSEYAKTTEVAAAINTAVSDLIDGAPETLDTLKELADNFNGVATQTWVNSQGFITEHYTVTIDV